MALCWACGQKNRGCVYAEWGQVGLTLGPQGLPASGGTSGPRQSGSPPTSQCGAQRGGRWAPAHPLPAALRQHSGPQETHRGELRAPGWCGQAGCVGEKSWWPWHLCDAAVKGQEEEEKAEQRRFFSGEWESQEGKQPGEKKGRRKIRKMEETSAQQARAQSRDVPRLPGAFPL